MPKEQEGQFQGQFQGQFLKGAQRWEARPEEESMRHGHLKVRGWQRPKLIQFVLLSSDSAIISIYVSWKLDTKSTP